MTSEPGEGPSCSKTHWRGVVDHAVWGRSIHEAAELIVDADRLSFRGIEGAVRSPRHIVFTNGFAWSKAGQAILKGSAAEATNQFFRG